MSYCDSDYLVIILGKDYLRWVSKCLSTSNFEAIAIKFAISGHELDTFTRKVYVKGINPPVFDSPDYPRGTFG